MSLPLMPPTFWVDGTDPEQPWNDNALRLLIGQRDVNNATTAQPALTSPGDDGKCYIIQSTHTGTQWATFTPKSVAVFYGGGWYEFTPTDGFRLSIGGSVYMYTSGAWASVGGGGGSVAGSDKQVQFNDVGSFGAEAGFEYDKTTNTLTVAKINESQGSNIASAATTDIGAATGNFVHVTGTTTITGFGTVASGARRLVVFDGALTLTHNATSLILPTGANITTAAGDAALCVSEGSGNWRVTHYQKKDGSALLGGGGGLTNWTDGLNSSAPNATVPVASFTATNAATNVDAVIMPKGSGALLRQIPTNSTVGGNKRSGAHTVDWQGSRSAADQVASGTSSVIGGGASNKASGTTATIPGGDGNVASDTSATVGGGTTNTASGTFSTVAGGVSNTASGSSSFAAGSTNTASGLYSVALGRYNTAGGIYSRAGGYGSTARGLIGADVYSSYYNGSTVGKFQRGSYTFVARTTDATATAMTADLAAAGATNQLILANFMAFAVSGLVTARKAGSNDYATWSFTAAVIRDANAASTTVIAAVPTSIAASGGAAAWVLAISADTTNGGLRLTVTGAAATTIGWTAAIQTAEVFET